MKSHLATRKVGSEAVARRTGRTWEDWFKALNAAGAKKLDHKGIVALVGKLGLKNGWWQQMVTVGYEQASGKRVAHQKPEGFQISGSKTIGVPVAALFKAWTVANLRNRWLGPAELTITKATPSKSVRIAWEGGASRVDVNLYPKGANKSQVSLQHGKLPNAFAAVRMKSYWKERLEKLQAVLKA